MIAIIIATIAGVCATTQASVNAETRRLIKSPYLSAAFNFVFSIIVLLPLILLIDHNLLIPFGEISRYPLWIWLGGCCGPFVIMTSVHSVPAIGSARHMMLACTAQILGGLIIDQFGLLGSQQIPMTIARFIGAALVLGGIVAASIEKGSASDEESIEKSMKARRGLPIAVFFTLSLINGTAAAVQVAANGTLNTVVDNALKTALISMCIGLTVTCLIMAVLSIVRSPDAIFEEGTKFNIVKPNRFMVYGGTLAVVVVGGNTVAANVLGTGLVNILNLAGMMSMSLFVDAIGLLGIAKKPVTLMKLIGMGMIIAGAAIISLM